MWTSLLVFLAMQQGGLPPEWEVRKQLTALAENVARFQPLLEKIDPRTWDGAPPGYSEQVKRTRAEIENLITTTRSLANQPERLTLALDSYFRMVAVDQMLRSLEAGVRKYQNPAVADLLQGLLADETSDRERLRQYIVDLAADREVQFRAVDEEAQRCRAMLSRQPASGKERSK
jgi:hypothetical protein